MRPRGFTLIEMAVVLGIAAILGGLAYSGLRLQRRRADINNTASELYSLLHGARQSALATGREVVVMLFPNHVTRDGTGRVIVYEDGDGDLLGTASPTFPGYAPGTLTHGARSDIITTFDFPANVSVGPSMGRGSSATLPEPLAAVPVNVDCSFCAGTGTARRGAIRYFPDGSASFHGADGTSVTTSSTTVGESFSIRSSEVAGIFTLTILRLSGAVQTMSGAGP